MKKIVIFGAGQAGKMIGKLLHGSCELLAYADNNYKNIPTTLDTIPVISSNDIKSLKPDAVIISVLNKEAAENIFEQLVSEGIRETKILNINELRGLFDIRLSTLRLLAREINDKKVKGNVAELGVYKGYLAREMNTIFKERKMYLFDTFEGFDWRDLECENQYDKSRSKRGDFSDTSMEDVKSVLPYPHMAVFCKGYFPETALGVEDTFAFVSIDTDLYLPTYNGLIYFYPRLSKGGYILVHDYNSTQFPNVKKAVEDFSKKEDIRIIPLCDLHGSALII
ncbi:O-methyltransferase [Alkalibaculum bacchi]|uniref:O-methyltransferase n=1 Tax=Alkalibaculum bacchi TaxID=645887 RepID=A0A366I481_9FIRM|nr:TylF/MycF/NovP-related O-methyltransferase [Alkalibaculum bacchi]RBP61364.1 O-methyltransferase [Alkalibaculum bacchi]